MYHLHRTELNATFLETLRSRIDAERVTITVAPEVHEQQSTHLETIIHDNRQASVHYAVPVEAFSAIVSAFEHDATFDIVQAITEYQQPKHGKP